MTPLDYIHKPITVKTPPDFTVISTFAGGGGSSTGYVWAGGKVLLAVEWDANAVETYRLNHPATDVYHGDIAKLSVAECLARTGLQPGELDIFDGSPPCQGFSTAGKRLLDDPRNALFREYVRLLRGLQPKVFVMENVSGLVKGKMKLVFAEILTELKASGYAVSARLLNAKYFGVPQSRERLIFIGVREDLGIAPTHPTPQTKPIPLRIALAGVPHGDVPPLSPKYRRMAPHIKQGECAADHDRGKGFQSITRQWWGRPAYTLTKTNSGSGVGTPLHPLHDRSLSIPEAKRIGSFPDAYQLTGSFTEQWARIGNSVPPRMMQAVAEHIRDRILNGVRSTDGPTFKVQRQPGATA